MKNKYLSVLIIILVILIGLYFYFAEFLLNVKQEINIVQKVCQAPEKAIVARIIDGDTIVLTGGFRVRLLGINADEVNQPCYKVAKDRLEELLLNKEIILEKDNTDVDKYGRCLRYVFLNGVNINFLIVKEGLAVSDIFKTDTKYKDDILRAERIAQNSNIGCKWEK